MASQFGKSLNQENQIPDSSADDSVVPEISPPVKHTGRQGFLPITTNAFDRVFISVVCFVAVSLLWMRFIEAYIPIWGAIIISLVLAVIIIRWG